MARNKQQDESREKMKLSQEVSSEASAEQLQQNQIKKETRSEGEFSSETLTGQLPYTLTNDFFFKAFLQKNETALRGLLSALLSLKPDEISSVTITNPIEEGETIDDKNIILDIKLLLNDTHVINLEMQVANLGNWPERSLTYLCRMFNQLKSGEDYIHVKKTVHVSIMDFTPNDFPQILYSEYFLYNLQTGHKYSDKFAIYMLQLNQLGNPKDQRDIPEIYYWAQLFKAQTWEEIQMLAEKNEYIKQSIVTLQELTADEKAKMQMEARERYRRDLAASVELGKQQSAEVIQRLQEKNKQLEEKSEKDEKEKKQLQEESKQIKEESKQKDERIRKVQEEKDAMQSEMEERIRSLEAQLAQANKHD